MKCPLCASLSQVLHWDERRRDELPLPLDLEPGDLVPVLGELFRVQRVEQGVS